LIYSCRDPLYERLFFKDIDFKNLGDAHVARLYI